MNYGSFRAEDMFLWIFTTPAVAPAVAADVPAETIMKKLRPVADALKIAVVTITVVTVEEGAVVFTTAHF